MRAAKTSGDTSAVNPVGSGKAFSTTAGTIGAGSAKSKPASSLTAQPDANVATHRNAYQCLRGINVESVIPSRVRFQLIN